MDQISTLNTVLLVAVSGLGVISVRLKMQVMKLRSEKMPVKALKKLIPARPKKNDSLRSKVGKLKGRFSSDDALPRDADGDLVFLETPKDKHDKSTSDGYIDALTAEEKPQTNQAKKPKVNKVRRFSKAKSRKG